VPQGDRPPAGRRPSQGRGQQLTAIQLVSWQALAAVGVGAGAGVLSALAGVGGAVVSTPGIRVLGATPLQSVGSTVPAILPGAIAGTIRYARAGLVRWRVGLTCGMVGAATAMVGAWLSDHVPGRLLMVLTATLVLWSSVSVLRRPDPSSAPVEVDDDIDLDLPPPVSPSLRRNRTSEVGFLRRLGRFAPAGQPGVGLILVAVGLGAGLVAGFLGVGGDIVLVPAFATFLDLDVKETIATSLVAVAIMSVSSLTGHALEGHIDWAFALPLAVGVVPGARLGSRIAVAASDRTMRLLCGWLLLALGAAFLVSELVSA
jgi:uncharacterized membrane protein YfcA